jgi:hypothetical protein
VKVEGAVDPEALYSDLPQAGTTPSEWFVLQIYSSEAEAREATIKQALYLPEGVDLAASVRYGRALLVLPPNQSKRQLAQALAALGHLALAAP